MLLFFMACHKYHRTRHTDIVCTCKNMKQTRDSQMLKFFKCLWAWSQWLYKTNDSLSFGLINVFTKRMTLFK